ncbi:DNA-binding GntR family transcriptional regulator [Stella humosa]|uniref:DNA-binding GntR family transcriptional regulator n=2 Tax=Stella humosa TaxID=94 RepID=A0A3N1LJ61_9PROT|nr:DNA-binding GntR family transcriptional regulator [Stella humosa]BBK34741.1 GntR family transcriptional regulator [Stella humosa]
MAIDCKQSVRAHSTAPDPDREAIPTPPETAGVALAARVQAAIEALILDGSIAPGERLNEIALARRLGVSRGPVREAARALERSGLVTVIMNRGAFVRMLAVDEAIDTYELATLLFAQAGRQLAMAAGAAQALELAGLVDEMDRAIAAVDRERFFELNTLLHRRIVEMAPNRRIEAAYLEQTKALRLFRRRSLEPVANMAASNAEHRRLVEAILAGDGEQARARAEEHGRAGRGRFLAAIAYRNPAPPPALAEPEHGGVDQRTG